MEKRFGEEDNAELELELCLSLGGSFKKTEKFKPIENHTDGKSDAVSCVKDGEERECKRIRTECNGIVNGVDNGYGSGQYKEISKAVITGSPICSSNISESDTSSSSSRHEGLNCDQTKPVNNIKTGTEETEQRTGGSSGAVVVETTQECSNSITKENGSGKPPKPSQTGNGSLLPFGQMPCVTSTGNGPEGKTVNGFLYRYSKSEISIICVCHGTSFSPAEFIIHAGGTNVSHPLRHITVIPSTF